MPPHSAGASHLDRWVPKGYTLDIQNLMRGASMIVSRVQKWGNSQGLRLPKQVLDLADIAIGEEVEIAVANQQIVVKKTTRPKYNLAELVSRIPQGYKTKEVDWGRAVGQEEW
jgi:antitoxin MazE